MKVFIGVNEKSGEHLLLRMIEVINSLDPNVTFYLQASQGFIGQLSSDVKAYLLFDSSLCSVMGFIEPLKRLPSLLQRRYHIKKWIKDNKPDLVIGIDGPDFWLPIEKYAKSLSIYSVHVVSPSVWAWRPKRVFNVASSVDELYTLFDFEWQYYKDCHLKMRYFPHPLVEKYHSQIKKLVTNSADGRSSCLTDSSQTQMSSKGHLVCAPGSRGAEVKAHLETFISVGDLFVKKGYFSKIVIPCVQEHRSFIVATIEKLSQDIRDNIELVSTMPEALSGAKVALCVSGTATLECALFKVPTLVCYQISWWKKYLMSLIINTPYICLVNIILNKEVLPEIIGDEDFMRKSLSIHLSKWLNSPSTYDKVKKDINILLKQLLEVREKKCLNNQISQTLQQVSMKQEEAPLQAL